MPTNGGTFGMLGGLMMPIAILIALRKAPPGPVKKLILAGATGPETALKPTTAKIARPVELEGPCRSGVVVALPDGRYWVDVPRYQRRRWRFAIGIAVLLAIIVEAAWYYWAHIAR